MFDRLHRLIGTGLTPELDALPPGERDRVWQRVRRAVPDASTFAAAVLFICAPGMGEGLSHTWINPGLPTPLVVASLCVLLPLAVFLLAKIQWRRRVRAYLRRLLPHLCSACGYDLTANASGVCPECGRAVRRG